MLIQRANKYRAVPTPYQAQAMGQWVGACRWEYNAALERRIYEHENYGFRLGYRDQARELTTERASGIGSISPPSMPCNTPCGTSKTPSLASCPG
jgi:hypothetical protein